MAKIKGVGTDAPMVSNELGGKQSDSPYRADLLPASAVLSVAGVLSLGAKKYGPDNWRRITVEEHLNHAMVHVFAFFAGDQSDDHLAHAACRMLMALEIKLEGLRA